MWPPDFSGLFFICMLLPVIYSAFISWYEFGLNKYGRVLFILLTWLGVTANSWSVLSLYWFFDFGMLVISGSALVVLLSSRIGFEIAYDKKMDILDNLDKADYWSQLSRVEGLTDDMREFARESAEHYSRIVKSLR
ncbi:hypothetical protein ACFL3X_01650 [Gemmatimonadota bacterium]